MGTITQRKRKDGSSGFTAQIRIMKEGKAVYQESQTFDRKATAQAWIRKREAELYEPGAIEKANRKGVTVKQMIDQYRSSTRSCARWARPSAQPSRRLAKPGWARLQTRT